MRKTILWLSIIVVIFLTFAGCTNNIQDTKEQRESSDYSNCKNIIETDNISLMSKIPTCIVQGGCYVENGLYIIQTCSSFGDFTVLRCFDSNSNNYIWEKYIEGGGHANSICFRPQDRKLYIAECYSSDGLRSNKIFTVDYDNIESGIIDTIIAPIPEGKDIYSIAYDRENDIFYGLSAVDGKIKYTLYTFQGVFKELREQIVLKDSKLRDKDRSIQGA